MQGWEKEGQKTISIINTVVLYSFPLICGSGLGVKSRTSRKKCTVVKRKK